MEPARPERIARAGAPRVLFQVGQHSMARMFEDRTKGNCKISIAANRRKLLNTPLEGGLCPKTHISGRLFGQRGGLPKNQSETFAINADANEKNKLTQINDPVRNTAQIDEGATVNCYHP